MSTSNVHLTKLRTTEGLLPGPVPVEPSGTGAQYKVGQLREPQEKEYVCEGPGGVAWWALRSPPEAGEPLAMCCGLQEDDPTVGKFSA